MSDNDDVVVEKEDEHEEGAILSDAVLLDDHDDVVEPIEDEVPVVEPDNSDEDPDAVEFESYDDSDNF